MLNQYNSQQPTANSQQPTANSQQPDSCPKFHVVYRISDKGYDARKLKLTNATKEHCLLNAIEQFGRENFYVICDNCSEQMIDFIKSQGLPYEETHLGNSPSFKYAVTKVVNTYSSNDIVYLLEDDYLHVGNSKEILLEGLQIADYVSLYDHPDQYMTCGFKRKGAAPLNRFRLHRWKIFVTEHTHWREAPSTTMTFAARVSTLKEDYRILMRHPDKRPPKDFAMFLSLTKQRNPIDTINAFLLFRPWPFQAMIMNYFAFFRKKRLLVTCIPGLATHCVDKCLSPLVDWTKV